MKLAVDGDRTLSPLSELKQVTLCKMDSAVVRKGSSLVLISAQIADTLP